MPTSNSALALFPMTERMLILQPVRYARRTDSSTPTIEIPTAQLAQFTLFTDDGSAALGGVERDQKKRARQCSEVVHRQREYWVYLCGHRLLGDVVEGRAENHEDDGEVEDHEFPFGHNEDTGNRFPKTRAWRLAA